MIPRRAIAACLLALVCAAVAASQATLHDGQSPAEVAAVLGKPERAASFGPASLIVYPAMRVYFEDDKLVDAQPRSDPAPGDAALLIAQSQFAQAAALFQPLCDAGDGDSCIRLAYMVQTGMGVTADPARAGELYSLACAAGNATGCVDLGDLFNTGLGAPQDYPRARECYAKACDAADASACLHLARLWEVGHGVAADPLFALALYRKACQLGSDEACASRDRLAPHPSAPEPHP